MKKHFILFILIWAFAGLLPLHAQQPTEEKKASQAPNFFEIQRQFKEKWSDTVPPPGSGYKPYKRWEYFWQHRIFPDGSFPDPDYREQAWTDYVAKHPEAKTAVNSVAANWTSLGPNTSASGYNGVGRVNCIAFHPTNSNIIWVGTAAGGIWKSTNGGNTWTTTTDNLIPGAVLGVSSIVVSASNPNILYAATGDKGFVGTPIFPSSIGVLKSTDGGATWTAVGAFPGVTGGNIINHLTLHPNNGDIIIAATIKGLFRSINGGASWKNVRPESWFYDVKFKPGSQNIVYAVNYDSFFLSTNGGETWELKGTVPNSSRIQMAVTPANPAFIALISSKSNGSFNGFYTSTNSGSTFALKYSGAKNLLNGQKTGSYTYPNGDPDYGQGTYDLCITVSPTNANIIFIGAVNLWKSTDGGLNWTLANYWDSYGVPPGVQVVHADKHCLAWQSNSVLFQSNDGGIYKSTNGGSSWTDLSNSLVISQIYRIGVSSADSKIICGLQDNSTKLKNSNGLWTDIATGDGAESFIDPVYPNIIYYSRINGDLRKTTDGGNNVQSIKPQQLANVEGDWLTPWAMDPNASNTIYAGYLDVWKSTNGGISWTYISLGLSSTNLTSLAVAPSNSNVIYVSNGSQIWKTTSGGGLNPSNWINISTGINLSGSQQISYIAIDPADPNKVYVTLNRYGAGNHVFKSTNGGTSWINFSGSLPDLPANCITVQPQGNNAVYVGTDIGVFYRDATMSDWEPFNTGLPNVIVTELECKTTAGKIYAATFGRGLWESNLAGASGTNSLSISPGTQTVNSSAGNASLSIASNISWTVSDNASWLTLSQSSGSGNASINASFTANTGTSARTATITASGGGNTPTATIVQSGAGGTGCNTPGNNQTSGITQNSALLSWSAVAGATSYALQYRLAPNGAWTDTNPTTFTSSSVTLNSLLSGTAYEWRVKTNCSNGTASNWSNGNAFTTAAALSCNTPTNLQSSNITQNSATLNWGTVLGAANYALQYRLGSSGNWLNTSPATTSGTSFTLSGLVANTTYQWRVSTNCTNGIASSWSAGIAFTTLAAPTCNTPVNLITGNVTQNSALVSWSAVSGAANYTLQTRSAPNWIWANTNPPTFTGTSVTISGLTSNTAYEWRVRTNCTNGLTSAWSSEEAFTTLPAQTCNAPASLSTNSITQTSALLSWSAVSGASSYRVQLYSGGSWLDLNGGPFTTTSVNLYGLLANDYYEWRVITICSNGLQSAPSYVASFYTQTAPVCYGGGIFPNYDLYPQGSWQYVYYMYGGQYSIVNVVAGYYYTFSFCSNHGGYVGFDGEIHLRKMDETLIAYNDDFCGTAPKIAWLAGYTGQVQVLLTKYPCTEQFTFSTLAYRLGNSFNDDIPDDRSEPDGISVPFVLDPPSSIAQVESAETAAPTALSISVFPNPASNAFTVQYEHHKKVDTNIRMFVYNPMGALLWEQAQTAKPGVNLWEVQTNHWPTGLYKVRLIDEQGGQCTQTVFIQD